MTHPRALLAAACALALSAPAFAGPAKGGVECEGAKHEVKSTVAFWVPEKLQFQMLFLNEAMADADLQRIAFVEGASALGRPPKGAPAPTAEDMKLRQELSKKRAVLLRANLKAAAEKLENAEFAGAFLVSVNCGPNKSFNQSMRSGDKDASADLKKQFPGMSVPLKAGATVKVSSAKYDRKPDPAKKSGSQMSAKWQFGGETKLVVIE